VHSVAQPDITQAPTQVDKLVAESVQVAMDEGVFDYPITVDCAADLPAVQVNHLQVVKVLLNLIHNGAQAMHGAQIAHGKLDVSTALTADGSEVCVSVRDVGPGISADLQAEVFQPFITTKSHGLGMGLTISRALIEANGGKLWHTPNDGPGATFHFTLPVSG
jgi:C4-dicarboxylate-specific signal transduction histidine kinase